MEKGNGKVEQKDSAAYAKVTYPKDDIEWACAKCTLINSKTARICTICGASKNPPIIMNEPDDIKINENNEVNIY